MKAGKLATICLFFLCVTSMTIADDPNSGGPDFSELGEISYHWVEDYTPEPPDLPQPPNPNNPPCVKTLYIDGAYVNDANAESQITSYFDRITIGAGGDYLFLYDEYIGSIDEFAVYEGVLDSNRVQAHYNAKDSNDNYYAAVDQDNPLLWLRFEDADTSHGDIAANSGSSDVDCRYIHTGGTAPTKVTGINPGSYAVSFPDTALDGDGTCIDVNDPEGYLGYRLEGDLSVELWVNFVDLNNPSEPDNKYPRFFQRKTDYGLYSNNDPNTLGIFGGDSTDYIDLPYDINDGSWHHIVITYDSTYLPIPCFYDYEDYVQMDDPVLYLRFEDYTPQDSSGNNNWVSYGSAASVGFEKGGMGNSLYLDGTEGKDVYGCAAAKGPNAPPGPNDPVPLYDDLYAFAPNDVTFEMWYSCSAGQDPFATFFQQAGGWENEPRAPGVTNSIGTMRVFCGAFAWEPGVNPYFDGFWHHLVVTYDEEYGDQPNTMRVQLYIDSYKKAESVFTDPNAKLGPELSHLLIGAQNDMYDTYNPLNGHVDEFAIYEGVLDPNSIVIHFLAWQPRSCQELWDRQLMPPWAEIVDKDQNCRIDFYDFAAFAAEWAITGD